MTPRALLKLWESAKCSFCVLHLLLLFSPFLLFLTLFCFRYFRCFLTLLSFFPRKGRSHRKSRRLPVAGATVCHGSCCIGTEQPIASSERRAKRGRRQTQERAKTTTRRRKKHVNTRIDYGCALPLAVYSSNTANTRISEGIQGKQRKKEQPAPSTPTERAMGNCWKEQQPLDNQRHEDNGSCLQSPLGVTPTGGKVRPTQPRQPPQPPPPPDRLPPYLPPARYCEFDCRCRIASCNTSICLCLIYSSACRPPRRKTKRPDGPEKRTSSLQKGRNGWQERGRRKSGLG